MNPIASFARAGAEPGVLHCGHCSKCRERATPSPRPASPIARAVRAAEPAVSRRDGPAGAPSCAHAAAVRSSALAGGRHSRCWRYAPICPATRRDRATADAVDGRSPIAPPVRHVPDAGAARCVRPHRDASPRRSVRRAALTPLSCARVHYAGGTGLCLVEEAGGKDRPSRALHVRSRRSRSGRGSS